MEQNPFLTRVRYRIYIFVWIGLCGLTAATVFAASEHLPAWGIPIAIAISGTQAFLVINYFMHLRHDRRLRLIKLIFPVALAILVIVIGLTFVDELFRH
jgi:caa(3)-type oxidase subunit IV